MKTKHVSVLFSKTTEKHSGAVRIKPCVFNTLSVVYFSCLSGRSYLPFGERSVTLPRPLLPNVCRTCRWTKSWTPWDKTRQEVNTGCPVIVGRCRDHCLVDPGWLMKMNAVYLSVLQPFTPKAARGLALSTSSVAKVVNGVVIFSDLGSRRSRLRWSWPKITPVPSLFWTVVSFCSLLVHFYFVICECPQLCGLRA